MTTTESKLLFAETDYSRSCKSHSPFTLAFPMAKEGVGKNCNERDYGRIVQSCTTKTQAL